MAEFSIPYGKSALRFMLPDHWETTVLEQRQADESPDAPSARPSLPPDARSDAPGAIRKALADLGRKYAAAPDRRSVAVAVNDKTRPVPHHLLLPPLLDWLLSSGYGREDVTIIIASGAHPPMELLEFSKTVPEEILADWRVISHDAFDRNNLVDLGFTPAGTPCEVNSIFFNSDLKIVVGNIEPHQFMGWSGGVKSAAIGLAGAATITANHRMLNMEGCGPCRYGDNPIRQDVEELGRLIGVDLALNVVLNGKKEILDVFAGDPVDVMTRGIALGLRLFTVPVEEPADVVIVSAGGYPKDINLYQAQKALRHAVRAAGTGAPVILAAACGDGLGSESWSRWMEGMPSFEQVKRRFDAEDFQVGPHKAMLFADDAAGRDVYLVSELPDDVVRRMLLIPAASVEDALNAVAAANGRFQDGFGGIPPTAAVIPMGNSTVPTLPA